MTKATFTISDDKKSLLMERTFPTSADRLWQAYADPTLLGKWFSPKGWVTDVKSHEFVDGGFFAYVMKCVDESQDWFGQTSSGKMRFENINPKSSFEYTDVFTDEAGVVNGAMPTSHSYISITETGPMEAVLKVKTSYPTAEALKQVLEMGMEHGYSQTLDKLEELLLLQN